MRTSPARINGMTAMVRPFRSPIRASIYAIFLAATFGGLALTGSAKRSLHFSGIGLLAGGLVGCVFSILSACRQTENADTYHNMSNSADTAPP